MRVALVIHDDNGSVEVASVECESFTNGCYLMKYALRAATEPVPGLIPGSTAKTADPVRDAYTPAAIAIWAVMEQMGDLEDLPTVSC